jgi:Kef-type K+ transport system membrane component KefB
MSSFLQLALGLAVILAAAKLSGYASVRLGQPAVLGELIMGLILGPSVLGVLQTPLFAGGHTAETIHELADLGVLLLMFIAGLDLHLSDLAASARVSVLAGTLGVIAPVGMGFVLARLFGIGPEGAVFVGLILAATSVSISAQTLMELKALRSRVGISLLGAAVFDDILVVLGLSIFVALVLNSGSTGLLSVVGILAQMVGFLLVAAALGFWLLPTRLSRWVDGLPVSQGLIAFVLTAILLYSWTAEVLGNMAAITGAFLAGLVFARSPFRDRIRAGISTLAYGLFVPIFFVNIGLSANARELLGGSLLLMLAMTLVAVISKVIGAGLGGRLGGLTGREALQLGVGIDQDIFAAVVGVVILTTLLTPPLLRSLFKAPQSPKAPVPETTAGGAAL